jgi:hypothetical protein
MKDLNGPLVLPPLITKRCVWKERAKGMWTTLKELPPPVRLALLVMCALLVGSLTGCAVPSSPPSAWPQNPQPPQISTELPQESYSSRVLESFKNWQQRLTGTPGT